MAASTTDRVITARFNGRCADCGAALRKGERIRYSKAEGARCATECFDAEAEAERRYFDQIDRQYEIRGFYDGGG